MKRIVLLAFLATCSLAAPAVVDVLMVGAHEVPQVPEVLEEPFVVVEPTVPPTVELGPPPVPQAPPWCLEDDCLRVLP